MNGESEMNNTTDREKDLEYIRDKFSSDGIKAPDSLNEDSVMAMISGIEPDQEEVTYTPAAVRKRPSLRKWGAAAACAVVALFGVMQVFSVLNAPPNTDIVDGELYTFKDKSEINRLVKSLRPEDSYGNWFGRNNNMVAEDADEMSDAMESADSSMAPKATAGSDLTTDTGAGAEPSHSETYLQVEDVDEADIVKTDGKYIYYVNDDREVIIMSAKDGKTGKLSVIGSQGVENYIEDIYLKGDRLVTVGQVYEEDEEDGYAGIAVYDISDRKDPQLISVYRQSGDVVSSRMVGDNVYLVTSDYVYEDGRILPRVYVNGEYRDMEASDICCVPDPQQSTYVVLGAVDITSGKNAKSETHAVFGVSQDIYCNDHNLYAAANEWDGSDTTYTRIVRASLDGLNVRFNATARVRGYFNDQFSMDEKDGYLRIATTSQRGGMDVNNLYVLDPSLKETGKLTGFARNESIRAVRYFGDKAYVITYEQIDPLFVIDLSDPSSPSIDGEVKIDGFSTLLIPAGKGKLLGIGHATGDNGYGGQYASGLKLVLFDISNPSAPSVIDSMEFEDMDSPAQYTHKALNINTDEGWYAIPYSVWHYNEPDLINEEDSSDITESETGSVSGDTMMREEEPIIEDEPEHESGVLIFGADDELTIYDRHRLECENLTRSVYIDDYIYAIDDSGEVSSFRFSK